VTFAILPDAVAFAAVARVPTIQGLYGAFFMCLIGMFLMHSFSTLCFHVMLVIYLTYSVLFSHY
jgi:MFS superfamily sulfate permease-like transporter